MQGAHGMWELSVNKAHHADMVEDLLEALVAQLACPDLQVCMLHWIGLLLIGLLYKAYPNGCQHIYKSC